MGETSNMPYHCKTGLERTNWTTEARYRGDHVWVSRNREHFQQQGAFKLGLRDEVSWRWAFQALGQKVMGHTCKNAMHRTKGEQASEVGGGHSGCRSPLLFLLLFFTDCSAQ